MSTEYRPPILAIIFRGVGCFSLLVAVLLLFFAFQPSPGASTISYTGIGSIVPLLYAAFSPALAAMSASLLCFGFGQIIAGIAQIAHHASELHDSKANHAAKTTANFPGATLIPPLTTLGELVAENNRQGPGSPRRLFYYQLDDAMVGPADEEELQRLVDARVIDHDTPIRAVGTGDWRRLEDMAEP